MGLMPPSRLRERLLAGLAPEPGRDGWRPSEVAKALGSSRQYIHKLLAAGVIQGAWRVGRDWRIPNVEAQRILREAGRLSP